MLIAGCKADCSNGSCKTSNKFSDCGCCSDGTPYCGGASDCQDSSGTCAPVDGDLDLAPNDVVFIETLTKVARSFGAAGEEVARAAEDVLSAASFGDVDAYNEAVARFDAAVEKLSQKQSAAISAYVEAGSEVGF